MTSARASARSRDREQRGPRLIAGDAVAIEPLAPLKARDGLRGLLAEVAVDEDRRLRRRRLRTQLLLQLAHEGALHAEAQQRSKRRAVLREARELFAAPHRHLDDVAVHAVHVDELEEAAIGRTVPTVASF